MSIRKLEEEAGDAGLVVRLHERVHIRHFAEFLNMKIPFTFVNFHSMVPFASGKFIIEGRKGAYLRVRVRVNKLLQNAVCDRR
jgi:hypothetical protein